MKDKKQRKQREKGRREPQRGVGLETPPKVTFLCRPIVSLLRLASRSEARLLVLPPTASEEAAGSETVAAEVLQPNESWMRLCEHC